MSKNVAMVPLNPAGALEMGLWPCTYCEMGWSSYTKGKDGNTQVESCKTDCPHIANAKIHLEEILDLKGKY